jgi:lycopene beta-cyclase
MVHPATGFSVATSLHLAPLVAKAITTAIEHGPAEAAKAARRQIWAPRAKAVHALRLHGLRALRSLPADALPQFFELFFALPEDRQRAFTSGREDLSGTTAAMADIFRHAPWNVKARLLR